MNNLTTRRIIFGLLMTLVLMFGVQGVADAVSDPDWTLQSNTDIITDRRVGIEFTVGEFSLNGEKVGTTESVTITISPGITLSQPVHSTSSVTLTEKEVVDNDPGTEGNQRANGMLTYSNQTLIGQVKGHFTTAGKKEVKVKGIAYDDAGDATSWSYTFIYYVTQPTPDREKAFNLQNLTDGYYNKGNFDRASIKIHSASGNFPVTYTVSGTDAVLTAEYPSGGRQTFTGTIISSALNVYLQMGSATSVVTAVVDGSTVKTRGVYIYGFPTLTVGHPGDLDGDGTGRTAPDIPGSKENEANINQMLPKVFTATVEDGTPSPANVSGVVVKFQVSGSGDAGGYLVFNGNTGTLVTSNNKVRRGTDGMALVRDTDKILYVRTEGGIADVGFEFGTNEKQDVTISTVGITRSVSVYTKTPDSGPQFTQQSSQLRAGKYDLRATVTDDGVRQFNQSVEFATRDGTLITPATGVETESNDILLVTTNQRGEVFVVFDPDDSSSSPRVTADLIQPAIEVTNGNPRIAKKILDSITFNITGSSNDPPLSQTARLTIRVDGTGTRRAVTVTATNAQGVNIPGLRVALTGTALTTSRVVDTGTATVITLPTTPDDYTVIATLSGYGSDTETVTVAASAALGTFSITTVDAPVNGQQTIEITARNSAGTLVRGDLVVTLTGPGISRTVDTVNGTGRVFIRIPTTTTSYTLTVSADGYTTKQETFTTTGQTVPPPGAPSGPAGEADSVEIDGQRQRSGTVNEELAAPLRVRVVDANDNGVEDVRVVFRVLSPGRGTFPGARGSGRATQDQTDRNGYVSVDFTPISTGNVTVRATPAGGIAPVTFIIDVGEAADDDDPEPPTPSRDEAPSREISPVVHLGMASRPPMLWVDGGAIYALVGADVQKFAPGVDNALNITVGGGKVYWTEKTGESSGTINSANVDGTDVKELTSIRSVPMGIAVDTAGSKLYWTNSRGRIQSADLDGSGITNVIPGGLESPMDLALAGGNGYWTQGNGSVRVGNLTSRVTRDISTGTDTPGSIVIGGNKVYWTEMTGDSSGTIKSANLNGTDVKELTSIQAVPSGIAVDTVRSKLYWTNSRGRVQSANLDGSKITNVVSGLGSPGELVLSNSIMAPAAAPAETASGSKYDVNGDGTVDLKDRNAVAVASLTDSPDAKYDVNGDGAVDAFDLIEIIENLTPGAAGAPTLFGMQLTVAQIDRLQEQIDLLVAANDRSPAAMRTLIYLQQLLVTARPEKTQLLANYPNPFNPETWIPYELATDTHVKVTIYNTQGVVIRTLPLGHQSAGYYVGRDRAAYWDGRNALGEQVASGLYFYQLETDEMSLMRKMVILK